MKREGRAQQQQNGGLGTEKVSRLHLEPVRAGGVVRGAVEELLGSGEFILKSISRGGLRKGSCDLSCVILASSPQSSCFEPFCFCFLLILPSMQHCLPARRRVWLWCYNKQESVGALPSAAGGKEGTFQGCSFSACVTSHGLTYSWRARACGDSAFEHECGPGISGGCRELFSSSSRPNSCSPQAGGICQLE